MQFVVRVPVNLFLAGLVTCSAWAGSVEIASQLVASGFDDPVFLTAPPNDPTRLMVLEQSTGRIMLIKNGSPVGTPYLDIDNRVTDDGGEQGLLGMAFHPEYAKNRYIFVSYIDNNGNTRIERYKARKSFDAVKKKTRAKILFVEQPFSNHNGGMIAFGPNDGYLYVGLGDGGSANDPYNTAQRLDTLLGKFLRIGVDGALPYTVPSTNPFVGEGGGALGEIWTYGWRNPWRWSFDRQTGDLYAGDVGQDAIEEIDFQTGTSEGGENYGWKVAEGFACRGGSGSCGGNTGYTPPILDYTHFDGTAVVGGYVYRGTAIAGLSGTYFFADYTRGRIWSLKYNGDDVTEFSERTDELDPPGLARINKPASFGEDSAGELYIVDRDDGEIYKIISG
ncbi:MAG: PQQ-dependent sugar dehydrogenase [Candidatus Hydrogenedentes bacterium]|nr:PQQ-dependent sugar dehydrogenase [Candidatus Hydrogenedentota bacterium]